jgi:hypothetical protein
MRLLAVARIAPVLSLDASVRRWTNCDTRLWPSLSKSPCRALPLGLRRMATLAAYPSMMQRDRKREGLRVCRAAWCSGSPVRRLRIDSGGRVNGAMDFAGPGNV